MPKQSSTIAISACEIRLLAPAPVWPLIKEISEIRAGEK